MSKSAAIAIEVRWRVTGSGAAWSAPKSFPVSDEIAVDGLKPSTPYDFEARAVSNCGAKSAWVPSNYTLPGAPAGTLRLDDVNGRFADYVTAVTYNSGVATLQSQIDGQIDSYFDTYDPTPSNAPASGWTTTTDKDAHLGDTFTNVWDGVAAGGSGSPGGSWRWAKVSLVYQWVVITDTATQKALALAGAAQDTADGKRRVFVATPTTPYDVGDLWVKSGQVWHTTVARTAAQSYTAADWTLDADKTGDNTAAGIVNQGALATKDKASLDDDVTDGTAYRRVGVSYVDTNGRLIKLWDGTTIRDVEPMWDGSNRAMTGLNGSGYLTTRFATARNIAGVSFDGSANIAIPSTGLSDSINLARGGDSITRFGGRTLDNIADSATYARVNASNLNGGNLDLSKSSILNRTADYISESGGRKWAAESGADKFNIGAVSNLDSISGTRQFGFTHAATSAPDMGYSYDATGVQYTQSGQTIQEVTLSDDGHYRRVDDGGGFGAWVRKLRNGEMSDGLHKLGVAGSGMQLGDQRNAPSSLTRSLGIVRSTTALSAASSGAVSVNAHSIRMGAANISYSAKSNAVTGLTQGTAYYIYTRDNYAGGSPTYAATTSSTTVNRYDDLYNAGVVTIPTSGSSGGGGGGGNPGDECVCADMWLRPGLKAGELADKWRWWKPWTWYIQGPSGWHRVRRRPRVTKHQAVRVFVEDGAWVDCSITTPVDTCQLGTTVSVNATDLHDHLVWTDSGLQRVTHCELIGERDVVRIYAGGDSYYAGSNRYMRISTHNDFKP